MNYVNNCRTGEIINYNKHNNKIEIIGKCTAVEFAFVHAVVVVVVVVVDVAVVTAADVELQFG